MIRPKVSGSVHVGRAMQGEQGIGCGFRIGGVGFPEPQALQDVRGSCPFQVKQQAVYHDVADEEDLLLRNALAEEVRRRRPREGVKSVVGDGVGDEAVDLLGHGPVEAAEAGLDVGDGDTELRAASAQAIVELTSPTTMTRSGFSLSSTFSNSMSTLPVCSAWLPEPTPRWTSGAGMLEVPEEDVRHVVVVVLAGVDEKGPDRRFRFAWL